MLPLGGLVNIIDAVGLGMMSTSGIAAEGHPSLCDCLAPNDLNRVCVNVYIQNNSQKFFRI